MLLFSLCLAKLSESRTTNPTVVSQLKHLCSGLISSEIQTDWMVRDRRLSVVQCSFIIKTFEISVGKVHQDLWNALTQNFKSIYLKLKVLCIFLLLNFSLHNILHIFSITEKLHEEYKGTHDFWVPQICLLFSFSSICFSYPFCLPFQTSMATHTSTCTHTFKCAFFLYVRTR